MTFYFMNCIPLLQASKNSSFRLRKIGWCLYFKASQAKRFGKHWIGVQIGQCLQWALEANGDRQEPAVMWLIHTEHQTPSLKYNWPWLYIMKWEQTDIYAHWLLGSAWCEIHVDPSQITGAVYFFCNPVHLLFLHQSTEELQAGANCMNTAAMQVIIIHRNKSGDMNMEITKGNNANMSLYKSSVKELLHSGSR